MNSLKTDLDVRTRHDSIEEEVSLGKAVNPRDKFFSDATERFWSTQARRQAKRQKKLWILEAGQGRYGSILQRQKLDGMRQPCAGTRLTAVQCERGLRVCGGSNETERSIKTRSPSRFKEGPDRSTSLVPLAPRRHAVNRILLEERDKSIEVRTSQA